MTFENICNYVKKQNKQFDIQPFIIVRQLLTQAVQNKQQLNRCASAAQQIAQVLHIGTKLNVQLSRIILRYIRREKLSKVGIQQWVFIIKSANIVWPKETICENVFIPLSPQKLYEKYNINKHERWRAKYIKKHKKGKHDIIAALLHAKEINDKSNAIISCHWPDVYNQIRSLESETTFHKRYIAQLILNNSDKQFDNQQLNTLLREMKNKNQTLLQEYA